MKQFKRLIFTIVLLWVLIAVSCGLWIYHNNKVDYNKEYLVEVNRIQDFLTKQESFSEVRLSDYRYIRQLDYLPVYIDSIGIISEDAIIEEQEGISFLENSIITAFYEGKEITSLGMKSIPSDCSYLIRPLFWKTKLQGYVRYSFNNKNNNNSLELLILVEGILLLTLLAMIGLMVYIQQVILKPFYEISDLPYELAKGHLSKEMRETKNRYFGRFLWGLELLRQDLEEHKSKELQLQRDKKLMILSISHDIKTPLSTIKLYSKALYENLYSSEEKKQDTARKIEEKADQIENFVSEIIKASSSELFEFQVVISEFYLRQLIEEVKRTYEEKLQLLHITFEIMPFTDKLLVGDRDKMIDVFDNLLQNAIKYGDGRRIKISFEEEDNCLLIRVYNTGIPLPVTQLYHMFDSFWRGENAIGKQGNGLGLYICKQLMKKMEGDIFAETHTEGISVIIVMRKY